MNLNLNYKNFEDYLIRKRELCGGIQYLFKFKNRYGASVVKHTGSYGHNEDLWELAVIWYPEGSDFDEFNISYTTPLTDDVLGYLDNSEVIEYLNRINNLTEDGREA